MQMTDPKKNLYQYKLEGYDDVGYDGLEKTVQPPIPTSMRAITLLESRRAITMGCGVTRRGRWRLLFFLLRGKRLGLIQFMDFLIVGILFAARTQYHPT
jgi:hypothetical protein